ncbi:hypothetical protein O181_019361 [Austropuccinia psidii MF-1]|uniref:Reverse transcriptase RNase H-like domain-containing protein n=1 Tax=Austropuccinia psidii MF-1 TaxID=1389203 RepID=A0A9Q3CBD7_9BASI|nr:hypothetical protein [Austropuccinia psidii MF-1]
MDDLLEIDVIRKIGHSEMVEITTPVLITWNDCKSRLCGYFRALNNYTKAYRNHIPRIPNSLDKLAKAKYIIKMDCMKGFHQNGVEPNSMKVLRMICHMGIYEYTRMPFGISNAPAHFQRMMETIFQEEILEGFYYRNYIRNLAHITSSLFKLCSKDVVFEVTKERRDAYERIKHEFTHAPVLILPYFELPLKLYIDAACSQGLGEALHQRQIVDGEPRDGVICYISRKLKNLESRYGATQSECLCLVWALEKLHYHFEGGVFEVYTDCTALKSLLNMNNTNRHMLRWKIAIHEYRGNITGIYKEGKSHTNADGLSRWPLDNVKSNPAHDPEVAAKIPTHFMEIYRRKNFSFYEWEPESGTPVSGDTGSEGTETPILGISSL